MLLINLCQLINTGQNKLGATASRKEKRVTP